MSIMVCMRRKEKTWKDEQKRELEPFEESWVYFEATPREGDTIGIGRRYYKVLRCIHRQKEDSATFYFEIETVRVA